MSNDTDFDPYETMVLPAHVACFGTPAMQLALFELLIKQLNQLRSSTKKELAAARSALTRHENDYLNARTLASLEMGFDAYYSRSEALQAKAVAASGSLKFLDVHIGIFEEELSLKKKGAGGDNADNA